MISSRIWIRPCRRYTEIDMKKVSEYTADELLDLKTELDKQYEDFRSRHLRLDMSRGKPAPAQLDLSNGLMNVLDDYHLEDGTDARNYGILDGIPEMKKIFSDLLDIPVSNIIIGGNASLNLMYDTIARFMLFGSLGSTPWSQLPVVKWLCPSPGYDRHFAVTQDMGIEMIPIAMTEDGPDMDEVERLAASDPAVKGIWCVPQYSNPQGICYSDETVDRLCSMKTAAADFRIMWDNAYGIHDIYEPIRVKDVLKTAREYGNEDRVIYFFSTSKITFPGAGVAMLAASDANIAEIRKHMSFQTIGHDKMNQLRHVKYFGNAEGVLDHMKELAVCLRPKFDVVLDTLDREIGDSGFLTWTKPHGGYFVSVDTLPGCAKRTVALAKEAGVVMTDAGATYPYGRDPNDTNIRIAPSYPTLEELRQAMHLFCLCVKMAGTEKLLKDLEG